MERINILIASDSFKGSLSSLEVAESMEKGFIDTGYPISVKKMPIADGGEGTVLAVTEAVGGEIKSFEVNSPFMEKTEGILGLLDSESVIIETASPLGLDKLKEDELDPMNASSFGLGEVIIHALDLGAKKIYIGLGGSSVNDGGTGMATALGAKLLDENNEPIRNGALGLRDIKKINIENLDSRLKDVKIFLLSDVSNPLCGKEGATYIYGPQKGVKEENLEEIDSWMKNYGALLEETFDMEILNVKGSGAAGGLGAALISFGGAEISSGIEKILETINMEKFISESNIVFTGEGRMDGQSVFGKAPIGVAKLAKKYNLPVIAIVGSMDHSVKEVYDHGIDLVLDIINEPMDLENAISNAKNLIEFTSYTALKHFVIWKNLCKEK